jgi:hypothetical protein
LPITHDTLDTIAGAKWFSILELKSACWEDTLNPTVKENSILNWQGLWQFTIMYFGLCNASAMFERLIESVLWGLTYKYLSYVTAVNTTNKMGTSSMKTTDVGMYLTYLM